MPEIQALPHSLRPSVRAVEYAPLDELLKKYANDEKKLRFLKKYEQYFKAITTDTTYNESLLNVTNEDSEYLRKHRLWFPYLKIDALNFPKLDQLSSDKKDVALPVDSNDNIATDTIQETTTTTKQKLQELTESLETNFFNYLHIPYTFGEEPIPPLINHVSNQLQGDIYTFGGLSLMNQKEQNEFLHYVTDDGLIRMENVQVNLSYNLPVPLNKEIIKSPFMKPNRDLYVYSVASQTLSKPDLSSKLFKKFGKLQSNDESVIPAGLIACQSCVISKRHIFYYGGFEIKTTITKHQTSTIIDREIVLSNELYVLDTSTFKFKRLDLTVHPTLTTRLPAAIPRFGHLCLLVTLEEMNLPEKDSPIDKDATKSSLSTHISDHKFPNPALVYIMGGYKQSKNSKDFIPLNDVWKVELFVNFENTKSNYITFNESLLAYPIGDFDLDQRNYDEFHSSRHSGQSELSSDEEEEKRASPVPKMNPRARRDSTLSQQLRENSLFTGIIKNDNIDWPDPRGFFAGSIFDNSDIYQDVIQYQDQLEQPVPKQSYRSTTISNFNDSSKSPVRSSSPLGAAVTDAEGTTTYSPTQKLFSPPWPTADLGRARQRLPQLETFRKISPSLSSSVAPSSNITSNFSSVSMNKTLMIHGGSTFQYRVVNNNKSGKPQKFTKKKILSDTWWLDLKREKWTRIPTYLNSTLAGDTTKVQEAEVKRCGHIALQLQNRYLLLMGGALEIDFKNERYFHEYKKDTSSDPKSGSDRNGSSGSAVGPMLSSDDSNVEDVQEMALKMGYALDEKESSPVVNNDNDENTMSQSSGVTDGENYHRMLILDTKTQCWRVAKYFHNFNLRCQNYTDSINANDSLDNKIAESLKRLFFSNICGTAVTLGSKIVVIGGECRPHFPEEITNLQKSSLADENSTMLFSSVCIFELPLSK